MFRVISFGAKASFCIGADSTAGLIGSLALFELQLWSKANDNFALLSNNICRARWRNAAAR